jgi:ERCC4-related helicase
MRAVVDTFYTRYSYNMSESVNSPPGFTHYHSQYLAHRLTLEGVGEDAFARSLSAAKVEMKPHQVDAALFALQSPLAKGVILADEVGLGKTIEAGLVIAQRWAERRRRILLIVPASLRKQWSQELRTKFSIPSVILDAKIVQGLTKGKNKAGAPNPFAPTDKVLIVSYEFADKKIETIGAQPWDLAVFDEAHRLRNVHKKTGSTRAKKLKQALGGDNGPFRVLLTATPLQNSLLELYGLVSIVDDHVFGDEAAFKANFTGKAAGGAGILMLKERLRSVMRRTLRKTVLDAGHINYTKRNSMVESFEPTDREHNLYLGVSAFLKRMDTVLFGERNNALVLMGYQKILGSSTFAIAQTLSSSIETLKRRHRASLTDVADIETEDENSEADESDEDGEEVEVDPVKLQAEILELTALRDLAVDIGPNAKGEKLAKVLPGILDQIVAKQGARKAVIFTESVRTQRYLSDLLTANGFAGQIALMNGSNNDAASRTIYDDWCRRHKNHPDMLSGSKSADMKAAIVEAFKDHKTILIATESGAEGINLQFCSVVINFDLPWNPQRIEQRIGRCHRYGQKIDVTVVNFLNLKNRAENRVFELLNSKFNLFDGVFGASDQVLGVIGDGIDFEARVFAIVQKCRNADETEAAFDKLQLDLGDSIKSDMQAARQTVMDNLDTSVVQKLKDRDGELKAVLSEFDRALLTIARAELPDATFHGTDARHFEHEGRTWTTEWAKAEAADWQFFRMTDGNLAQTLVTHASGRTLPVAELALTYDPKTHGVLGDVAQQIGASGWLSAAKVTFKAADKPMQRIVLAAFTDDGQQLAAETVERLFQVPGASRSTAAGVPTAALESAHQKRLAEVVAEVSLQTGQWFDEKTSQYHRYAADMEKGLDNEIADIEAEVKELREQSRTPGLALEQKLVLQGQVSKLNRRCDDLMAERFARKRKINDDVDKMLIDVAASLKLAPEVQPLFTVRWSLTR